MGIVLRIMVQYITIRYFMLTIYGMEKWCCKMWRIFCGYWLYSCHLFLVLRESMAKEKWSGREEETICFNLSFACGNRMSQRQLWMDGDDISIWILVSVSTLILILIEFWIWIFIFRNGRLIMWQWETDSVRWQGWQRSSDNYDNVDDIDVVVLWQPSCS